MSKRKQPNMSEKLGSALLEVQRLRGDPIDRDCAKAMTADQICSLFQFDHDAGYAAHGAGNHPTEMTPLLIAEHREKTAKKDKPAISKCTRLSKEHEEHRARLLSKVRGDVDEIIQGKPKKKRGFKGWRNFKGKAVWAEESR